MKYIEIPLSLFATSSLFFKDTDIILFDNEKYASFGFVTKIQIEEDTNVGSQQLTIKFFDGIEQTFMSDNPKILGICDRNIRINSKQIPISEVDNYLLYRNEIFDTNKIYLDVNKVIFQIKDREEFSNDDDYIEHIYDTFNKRYFSNRLPKLYYITDISCFLQNRIKGFTNATSGITVFENGKLNIPVVFCINPEVLINKKRTCWTVLHEMCHVSTDLFEVDLDNRNDGHGRNWRKEMIRINLNPDIDFFDNEKIWGFNSTSAIESLNFLDLKFGHPIVGFNSSGQFLGRFIRLELVEYKEGKDIEPFMVDIDGKIHGILKAIEPLPQEKLEIKAKIDDMALAIANANYNRKHRYDSITDIFGIQYKSYYPIMYKRMLNDPNFSKYKNSILESIVKKIDDADEKQKNDMNILYLMKQILDNDNTNKVNKIKDNLKREIKKLHSFEYGWYDFKRNNKVLISLSDDNIMNHVKNNFRILTPSEVCRYHLGSCFEFSIYLLDKLKEYNYILYLSLLWTSNNTKLHIVPICVFSSGKYTIIESVYKKYLGLYTINDLKEIPNIYDNRFNKYKIRQGLPILELANRKQLTTNRIFKYFGIHR